MTALDLEPVRDLYNGLSRHLANLECCVAHDVASWVPQLLAEIERTRAELVEEQTVHAKTFDNFEAHSEACLEQSTRQLDRYARLDADYDRLRKAHDELINHANFVTAETVRLRGELSDAQRTIRALTGSPL